MSVASLFNLAGPDLVIILLIVLFLFGIKNLPELSRGMAEAMRHFAKILDDDAVTAFGAVAMIVALLVWALTIEAWLSRQ